MYNILFGMRQARGKFLCIEINIHRLFNVLLYYVYFVRRMLQCNYESLILYMCTVHIHTYSYIYLYDIIEIRDSSKLSRKSVICLENSVCNQLE